MNSNPFNGIACTGTAESLSARVTHRRSQLPGATQNRKATLAAGVIGTLPIPRALGVPRGKVRVGIIGSTGKGDYGHSVDVAFTKTPNVEIVALADENPNGRSLASKRTNPKKTYADYREMLTQEKLDVVAICPRWIDQHHDMVVAAAKAGCHVYRQPHTLRNPSFWVKGDYRDGEWVPSEGNHFAR